MTHRVLGLLLILWLSVPVTAQTPWQPSRTPNGQPDMQGLWRNGTVAMVVAALSLESDHSRWQAEVIIQSATQPPNTNTVLPSYIVDPPDGKIPYQPWAAAKRQEFIATMMTPTKREHVDPHARAWLDGVPRVNAFPPPMQILQTPGYVILVYEVNHSYRVIPLDGRPHVGEHIKLFMGVSRGHWDGNTLVVDVTNQDARTWLD